MHSPVPFHAITEIHNKHLRVTHPKNGGKTQKFTMQTILFTINLTRQTVIHWIVQML